MGNMMYPGSVSYQAEAGYGTFAAAGIMLWPGMVSSFNVGLKENYDKSQFIPAENEINALGKEATTLVKEELPFTMELFPQKTAGFPMLPFVVGGASGLADDVVSTSWISALEGFCTLSTGTIFEKYTADIPKFGVMKETISGFAGSQLEPAAKAGGPPTLCPGVITKAEELVASRITWKDITSIKMDPTEPGTPPTTAIDPCIDDISFGFTNTVEQRAHPESLLTTRMCGVRPVKREMNVSLSLSPHNEELVALVRGGDIYDLLVTIAGTTFTFTGLVFPEYISPLKAGELVGWKIDFETDKYGFTYV